MAFSRWRLAVLVDGRFWHGRPTTSRWASRGGLWDAKIRRTQERDRLANEALTAAGWRVLRYWDFEIEEDLERCVREITAAVGAARATAGFSLSRRVISARTFPRPRLRSDKRGRSQLGLFADELVEVQSEVRASRSLYSPLDNRPEEARATSSRRSLR